MGMAASQARFLNLTARLNNVEYQGQQINQQRTLLSNESAQSYNSLLSMTVPTPPSKSDFTKTVYSFTQGSYDYSIDAVYPNPDNAGYTVNYVKSGKVQGVANSGIHATIRKGDDGLAENVVGTATGWVANGNQLYELNGFEHKGKTAEQLFQQMFNNTKDVTMDDFYVYLKTDDEGITTYQFIKKEDIESIERNTQDQTGNADVWRQESITSNEQLTAENAQVIFDTNGRMLSVIIEDKEYPLTPSTITDEDAYEEAFNKYEYEKYQYNQYVTEVNAKISIIQHQDKKLELQLEQLDTERTTITTEIEAVQKVLGENIDRTYKVFNG